MEKNIDERFMRLESALKAIRGETIPKDGHPDPGALKDCWEIVNEYIEAIKSKSRSIAFEAWNARNTGEKWDDFVIRVGMSDFKYLKIDNTKP